MVVKEYENARAYLKDYENVLLKQEAVSQLILYNAYQKTDIEANHDCLFGVVLDDEDTLLHFCNVAPYNLAVYSQNSGKESINAAAALLADYMVSSNIQFKGIIAGNDICQGFIEQYKKSISCTFIEKVGMDIMEIRQINEMKPAEGVHRLATQEEIKLLANWMVQFQIEARASEINYETALNRVIELVNDNKFYIYEDTDQNVVTMAAAARKLAHGVAISYIYTPEEHRGKGYAAANIYFMSKEFLENGNEFCTIFADQKNPLSNRAYEKIGYQVLTDNYEYQLILS